MINYPLANDPYHYVKLTLQQVRAIEDRDLLASINLGLCLDTYMSCIDPDYTFCGTPIKR